MYTEQLNALALMSNKYGSNPDYVLAGATPMSHAFQSLDGHGMQTIADDITDRFGESQNTKLRLISRTKIS